MISATCIAPVNIAVIKYWGKRDEVLILPINDSISMTLCTGQMFAKTTASASPDYEENKMWLNGSEVPFESNPRTIRCLEQLKMLAQKNNHLKFPLSWKLHICSENNFPTAAGLASSAAGYACLVSTLARLYGIEDSDLSLIARQGSGSACRSMYGGFVQWAKGVLENGQDSVAKQIKPASHWPQMHVLILVVSDTEKKTSSTKGMSTSVQTSDLLQYRAEKCVPERIVQMREAISNRDFQKFALLTMKDSNQFHAVCLDTYPPCVYMTDVSHSIVDFVHMYNETCGEIKVAYTFDAGPNACLYVEEENVSKVLQALNSVFPSDVCKESYIKGIPVELDHQKDSNAQQFPLKRRNAFNYIIHTKIGEGPQQLSDEHALINQDGLPINLR